MSLTFRHGCMNAAKTMLLLATRHNYESLGRKTLLVKPKLDTRDEDPFMVKSRSGLWARADYVVGKLTDIIIPNPYADIMFVDEAQFMTPEIIDMFRAFACKQFPVVCYGLKTDFRTNLFPGSRRLLEVADYIEEIPTLCEMCSLKAVYNMRVDAYGNKVTEGDQVGIEGEYKYMSVCNDCYYD